jgi:hypothetical protein
MSRRRFQKHCIANFSNDIWFKNSSDTLSNLMILFSHFQATLSTTDLENTGGAYLIKTFFNEV